MLQTITQIFRYSNAISADWNFKVKLNLTLILQISMCSNATTVVMKLTVQPKWTTILMKSIVGPRLRIFC